jgi:hypothetical protein
MDILELKALVNTISVLKVSDISEKTGLSKAKVLAFVKYNGLNAKGETIIKLKKYVDDLIKNAQVAEKKDT